MSRLSRTEALRRELVTERVNDLPHAVLECRSERHWWSQNGPLYKEDTIEGGMRGAVYATRLVTCDRCQLVTKIELWRWHRTTGLERIYSRTSYDKAYLVAGATRDDKVRALVQDMLIGQQMQDLKSLRIVG